MCVWCVFSFSLLLMLHLSFIHCTVVGLNEGWAWAFQSFKAFFLPQALLEACRRLSLQWMEFLHISQTARLQEMMVYHSYSVHPSVLGCLSYLPLFLFQCLSVILIIYTFLFILLILNQRETCTEQIISLLLYCWFSDAFCCVTPLLWMQIHKSITVFYFFRIGEAWNVWHKKKFKLIKSFWSLSLSTV